jgi:hypothetical protein
MSITRYKHVLGFSKNSYIALTSEPDDCIRGNISDSVVRASYCR